MFNKKRIIKLEKIIKELSIENKRLDKRINNGLFRARDNFNNLKERLDVSDIERIVGITFKDSGSYPTQAFSEAKRRGFFKKGIIFQDATRKACKVDDKYYTLHISLYKGDYEFNERLNILKMPARELGKNNLESVYIAYGGWWGKIYEGEEACIIKEKIERDIYKETKEDFERRVKLINKCN